jgi:hypothetical protein
MKTQFLILSILFFSLGLYAQKEIAFEDRGEKYQAQKVAYITTTLKLSPDESAAFWPLYNQYDEKRRALLETIRKYRADLLMNEKQLSEADALKALEFTQEHMKQMYQLDISYQNKYLDVISAKKVLQLIKAEKDFRRQLLRELGEKRDKRGRR